MDIKKINILKATDSEKLYSIILFMSIIILGIIWRVYLFYSGRLFFDADQTVSGHGALAILNGKALLLVKPRCFAFHGELYSYYFALLHLFFKPCVAVLRLGMIPWAMFLSITTFYAVNAMFKSKLWALISMTLITFPSLTVLDWFMRSSSEYIILVISLNLSLVFLFRILNSFDEEKWSRRNCLYGLGVGVALGVSYWEHLMTLICIASLALFLMCYPKTLLKITGFQHIRSIRQKTTVKILLYALQFSLLLSAAILSYIMIRGGQKITIARLEISFTHLNNSLIFFLSLLIAQTICSYKLYKNNILSQIGILSIPLGLCLGAWPMIWFIWAKGNNIDTMTQPVANISVAYKQFLSILHTGIPVLLGYFHNWKLEITNIPHFVKLFMISIHIMSFLVMVIFAIAMYFKKRAVSRGLVFSYTLFITSILLFTLSKSGNFIKEPRYLLPLSLVFAISTGGFIHLLFSKNNILKWSGVLLLFFILFYNIIISINARQYNIELWTGEEKTDKVLLSSLEKGKYKYVACRFSESKDYWMAYKLNYILNGKVFFSVNTKPYYYKAIFERYQSKVENAQNVSYMVLHGEESTKMKKFLNSNNVIYIDGNIGEYHLFCNLEPDILKPLSREDYKRITKLKNAE